ncbi:hypothetical protein EH32_06005 [Erythrobacter litoralis]|jgi:hypothetical protein|uniref:Uncharacterized protein n=1 Tax=Erythrobacter litoralis TaxID=39960 RepID=A0A074N155_9SPHN|nr:hypothetical protein EH32_06005 [Erythrobacter litoralis]
MVRIGQVNAEHAEVPAGLKEGESVLPSPPASLVEGTRMSMDPADAGGAPAPRTRNVMAKTRYPIRSTRPHFSQAKTEISA